MDLKRANKRIVPVAVATAIAALGMISLFVVDHGPWSRPRVKDIQGVHYATTALAAHAIGATVTATAPKPTLEPVAPGPKPAQPPNPAP